MRAIMSSVTKMSVYKHKTQHTLIHMMFLGITNKKRMVLWWISLLSTLSNAVETATFYEKQNNSQYLLFILLMQVTYLYFDLQ